MSNIMALEDFFTLVEMKEGLTVTARVEELVAAMEKEQDCILNNAGDAMRQWSSVASVIALTDNKECLDLFIQLDGFLFIDRWLKDAQTFSADADDCFVEDSILVSLQALEKLQIDDDKLTSSGICLTVRDLFSHKNIKIQDKAKEFLGSLKPPKVSGALKLDSEEPDEVPVNCVTHISSSFTRPDQVADIDQHVHLLDGDNVASSGCGVNKDSEGVESVVKESANLISHFSDCDLKEVNDSGECFVREETRPSEQKPTSELSDTEQGTDFRREVTRSGSPNVNTEIPDENLPKKLGKGEIYPVSITPKTVEASLSHSKSFVTGTDGIAGRCTDDHIDSSTMKSVSADLPAGGTWTSPDDTGALMNCTAMLAQKTPSRDDETSFNASQDSPVDGRKSEDLDNTYTDNESLSNESVERVKYDPSHFRDSRGFEPSKDCRSTDVTSKTSAMDLENGMFDALEVACLVAKEVEMQVNEDHEEHSGTFTKKSSRVEPLHHASAPDSLNGEEDQHADGSSFNESPVEKASDKVSSGEEEPSMSSDNVDAEQVNCLNFAGLSKGTDKGTSEIDLNFEICSEDASEVTEKVNADNSVSKPISVTSISKALSAPGFPAATFKFEGALGWKGSATSSAFRPASPRKTNADSTEPSRHGQDFVFDLNFSEDGGSVPSVEEAIVKPSPRSSEKLSFDLNLKSEDRDAPFSPSLKPAMWDFDLNDKPVSDQLPILGPTSSIQLNSYKEPFDDSVVSIMGAKVKKNTSIQQAPVPFLSGGGRVLVAVADANLARSGPHFRQYPPSFYSYNGNAVRPAMSFSHPVYGPRGTPANMMARGVSLVPQQMSAMSASPFAYRPPFTPNMMVQVPGPNRVNSLRPHVGFNSGFIEGSNRINADGFRQFFPAQGRPAEVQQQQQQPPFFTGIQQQQQQQPFFTRIQQQQQQQQPFFTGIQQQQQQQQPFFTGIQQQQQQQPFFTGIQQQQQQQQPPFFTGIVGGKRKDPDGQREVHQPPPSPPPPPPYL